MHPRWMRLINLLVEANWTIEKPRLQHRCVWSDIIGPKPAFWFTNIDPLDHPRGWNLWDPASTLFDEGMRDLTIRSYLRSQIHMPLWNRSEKCHFWHRRVLLWIENPTLATSLLRCFPLIWLPSWIELNLSRYRTASLGGSSGASGIPLSPNYPTVPMERGSSPDLI